MKLWLSPEKYPNLQANDRDVKAFFGLGPKDKWPLLGMPRRTIQGIVCWVNPAPVTLYKLYLGRSVKVKSSKHRTFGICPACGKTIPLGRMQQHAKIHKD